jgi:hypothetical protein
MVKKIDYFCGAFLSYLISNGITPALFEAGEKSKIVKFSTDLGDYKVYIKYSTTCKASDRKNTRKWDVPFTEKEMDILKNFPEQNRKHFFVLVCTDPDMKENEIAVLDFDNGLKCLGNDSVNKERRISVIHKKGSPYMKCYGTARSENQGIQIYKDFNRYFLDKAIDCV